MNAYVRLNKLEAKFELIDEMFAEAQAEMNKAQAEMDKADRSDDADWQKDAEKDVCRAQDIYVTIGKKRSEILYQINEIETSIMAKDPNYDGIG